jgi:nucleoside-diphosphate-sugar epimerase
MVVLIRPKNIIDRKTKEVVGVLSPAERGEKLLDQLCLTTPEQRAKFRFIGGDVEKPQFGVSAKDIAVLKKTITHLIHCAASVSFEDPYEVAYQINVKGTLNALDFSLSLQSAPKSPFIAHVGIETSYIHGRQMRELAREDEMVFPRNFYNNYYELTKAMGSLDTDRYMLEKGLRVIQLCPAIVIGALKTGNNRGDTKVVNAPINLFGRAKQALSEQKGSYIERTMAGALAKMASVFPGDPTAQLNLIPVDWVVNGIIAALTRPDAVGERVHLATDNRIKSQDLRQIVGEELGVEIRLAEPTLHRTVTLPVLAKVLKTLKQEKVANGLERLSIIFSPYNEWGQPTHEVGKDARILGLPETRPKTTDAFRMLCRHNRYVQDYGQVRDVNEIARRETVWSEFIDNLEKSSGTPVADISADDFRAAIQEHLDLESFTLK